MIIYHGSRKEIKEPLVRGSNQTNDYGPAFYTTLDLDAAKSWACKHDTLGVVSKYYLDNRKLDKFKILDLTNKDKYSILNWVAILMHFRELSVAFVREYREILDWLEKYYIDVTEYDVVIGYRADDSYFMFPIRFISGALSFEDLEKVFMLGNLGIQYAFISEEAVSSLKYAETIECEPSFLGNHHAKVKEASKAFDELLHQPFSQSKTYITDVLRKDNE